MAIPGYGSPCLDRARQRASAEGLDAVFEVGDAQALRFADDSFDVVLSVYGVQFVPDQERAAGEMLRVCRPGGRIALATPIPQGWSGDLFATIARHVPPPPGVKPPLRWGTEAGLDELLGGGTRSLHSETRIALQAYFAFVGRDRVGFSREEDNGEPRLVGGVRGMIERNVMRFYLALAVHLDTLDVPEAERLNARLEGYFAATDRYPRQLREQDRADYLDSKGGR